MLLLDWTEATYDLMEASALEPGDKNIKNKLGECRDALQTSKEEFYFDYNSVAEVPWEALKASQEERVQVLEMDLGSRLEGPSDGPQIEEINEEVENIKTGAVGVEMGEEASYDVRVKLPPRALWIWEDLFKELKNLKALSMELHIGPEGVKFLAEGLRTVKHLEKLSLRGCGARWQGAEAVANALGQNDSVLELDFSRNGIGARGAKALVANGLSENTTLTKLSLAGDHIGAKGVDALAGLLEKTGAARGGIVELDLSSNGLEFKDVRRLATMLREDQSLQVLDLSCNELRSDAAFRLATSAMAHAEMRLLDLRGRHVASSTVERIQEKGRIKRCQVKLGEMPYPHRTSF